MTSPTIKRSKKSKGGQSMPRSSHLSVPILSRRFAAWIVEISLVGASAIVPYSIGMYIQSNSQGKTVPLNPVLAQTEEAIAQTLALPRRPERQRQVAPLTNLFYWIALASPIVLTGCQIYLLGTTGQTTPKRWLKIRVITTSGTLPGLLLAAFREGVGHWGIPVGTAYIIWRYSGAFPDLGILLGLSGLIMVAETGMIFFGSVRRTLHDRLAGTLVVDSRQSFATKIKPKSESSPSKPDQQVSKPITLEVQSNWQGSVGETPQETANIQPSQEKMTTIVITPQGGEEGVHLWQWMRQNPGMTMIIVASAVMVSVLGTFVGTQIYIQSQANQREFKEQNNQVFLALVKQLSATSGNPLEERRAAILALARLDDSRAVPLLVDLLGQEKNPSLIETTQQSLASRGPEALPSLRNLNQGLGNDLKALPQKGAPQEQKLIALRIRATKRAIVKILTLHSGQLGKVNLNRTDLSRVSKGPGQFTLILEKVDLSGIKFRGSILSNGRFKDSRFYNAGEDGRLGTFDDLIADLSGVDLNEADLTGALLTNVSLNHTNLMRATLNRANLTNARLIGVNLSSAKLINANLSEAVLENASLTGADLGETQFNRAHLRGASLGRVRAAGADFSWADLTQSNWQGADLSSANLSNTNLQKADLSATKLSGANLSNAQLQNANLHNANLSTADLRGANLAGADFEGVIFARPQATTSEQFLQAPPLADSIANIKGVNFAKVKNLSPKQISLICSEGGYHPKCRSFKKKKIKIKAEG
ncbi:MAG: hypothetical protein F6K10_33760 [Moorea sp. SIO2B7]|nr:hypothetical protein [Moorena sp. SIO2B7]